MTDQQIEEGMTYVEKLDFREQAHRHEMARVTAQEAEQTKRAKYKLREARQETIRYIGLAIVAVLAVGGLLYAITYWTMLGPEGPDGLSENERRENACVQSGGGWVPDDLIVSGDQGLCVYPGQKVEAPASE